jgi:membrane protein implicated in regulation of membrane protease activity
MSPPVTPATKAPAGQSSARRPLGWAIAAILLLAAVAASLAVPIYARSTPMLGDFPFFYWYQLILVPAVAIVSWVAFLLVRPKRRQGGSDVAH